MEKSGILFIISAPSGAGKTSLLKNIGSKFSDLEISVA